MLSVCLAKHASWPQYIQASVLFLEISEFFDFETIFQSRVCILFFHLLIFVEGFGLRSICLELFLFSVNKRRILYWVRSEQTLRLSPGRVLRNLWCSSEVGYCGSLWKPQNMRNGLIHNTRVKTWHISSASGNMKYENTVFSVCLLTIKCRHNNSILFS